MQYSIDLQYTDDYGHKRIVHYDVDANSENEAYRIANRSFERMYEFHLCEAYRDSKGWHQIL